MKSLWRKWFQNLIFQDLNQKEAMQFTVKCGECLWKGVVCSFWQDKDEM